MIISSIGCIDHRQIDIQDQEEQTTKPFSIQTIKGKNGGRKKKQIDLVKKDYTHTHIRYNNIIFN